MYLIMKFLVLLMMLMCVHVVQGSDHQPLFVEPSHVDTRILGYIMLALLTAYFAPTLIRRMYGNVGTTNKEQTETSALYNSRGLPVILQGLTNVYYRSGQFLGTGSMADTYAYVVHDTLTMTVKRLHWGYITDDKNFFIEQMDRVGRVVPFASNVIPLRGYIFSKAQKLLIYDMVEGSTLRSRLHGTKHGNQMDLNFRIRVAIEVAKGIRHIHSFGQQSVHGNLKSTNIFITTDDRKILVSEMGLVPLLKVQMVVNEGYNAPEVVHGGNYTHQSDIYSFGILLLELLTGQEPHQFPKRPKMVNLKQFILQSGLGRNIYDHFILESDLDQRRSILDVALDCIKEGPSFRPCILEVIRRLPKEGPSFRPCIKEGPSFRPCIKEESDLDQRRSILKT